LSDARRLCCQSHGRGSESRQPATAASRGCDLPHQSSERSGGTVIRSSGAQPPTKRRPCAGVFHCKLQTRCRVPLVLLVRGRFLENGKFAKQYLHLLDEIRVNRQEVSLTGSYGACG